MINDITLPIIFVSVWLIFAEILYIRFMKSEDDMDEWLPLKFGSLIISGMVSMVIVFGGYAAYESFKAFPSETMGVIIIILGIILFFVVNYHVGKRIVEKNNEPKKKKRKKK